MTGELCDFCFEENEIVAVDPTTERLICNKCMTKVRTEPVTTGRLIDNGDVCPKCKQTTMPKVEANSIANGRCCGNRECRAVEVRKPDGSWELVTSIKGA